MAERRNGRRAFLAGAVGASAALALGVNSAPAQKKGASLRLWILKTYVEPTNKAIEASAQRWAQKSGGAVTVEYFTFEDVQTKYVAAIENKNTPDVGQLETGAPARFAGMGQLHLDIAVERLADEHRLPVYCFVDCDPYGIANIYRTLKVGSGNMAHINRFFCVPQAQFLGVTPQDIIDFKLQDATHKLQDVDVKRAKDALKNDPFFQHYKPWQKAMEMLISMGVRAEQQALAKWGLNYVIEEYLPRKLEQTAGFLP